MSKLSKTQILSQLHLIDHYYDLNDNTPGRQEIVEAFTWILYYLLTNNGKYEAKADVNE